jgi:5-methylthioadenosine/S-adenosylhomocysteine deaminase
MTRGKGKRWWLHSERVVVGGVDEPLGVAAATVEIAGDRIAAVVRETRTEALARHARALAEGRAPGAWVDRGGELVAPAFVDSHVHTAMLYFRGLGSALAMRGNVIEDLFYRVEIALEPGDVRAFARLGAYELLRAGTATVWEHYYFGEQAALGLADAGMTGFVAPTLQDVEGPGTRWLDQQLDDTLTIASSSALADAGLFAALGPHATDTVSDALWRRVAALSDGHGLPIHAHVAQSIEEVERAAAAGGSPVDLLARAGALAGTQRFLLVHGIYLSERDLQQLDASLHTLVFCPFSQLQFSFPADVLRWSSAGLPWTVATDCGACNDGMDVQKELRFVAGMRALAASWSDAQRAFGERGGLEAAQALEAVRRQAFDAAPDWGRSEALLQRVWAIPGALDARWPVGAIEPGRVAHLACYDAEHPALWPCDDPLRALAMGSPTPALVDLYVRGERVGGSAGVRGLADSAEVREASAEARARVARLLERVDRAQGSDFAQRKPRSG